MTAPSANANIARYLIAMAASQPTTAALKIPRGRTPAGDIDYLTLTFSELAGEVAAWQSRLISAGIRPADRTLVMVRSGLPLIAAAFALFSLGAVPIIIDPGMGLKNFLACVARSRPRALVGVPLARFLSHICRRTFSTVKIRVAASNSLTARLTLPGSHLSTFNSQLVNSAASDLAAVLFTSGSTGAPKGVCYEHGHFDAQVRLIRDTYGIAPGEIDLPLLPIFALFNPALGMTTIIPELDPRRPATLDPAKIVQAIRQENVTNSFGSPTLWQKIGDHCLAHDITLPTLRRVLCAGAPVPAALWKNSRTFLPHGQLHSPYGATEALPLATVSSSEIAALSGPFPFSPGACVGRPVREIEIKIIAISDSPIASLAEIRELQPGEIGEIIARGPVVTKSYDALPEATALAKIVQSNAQPVTLNAQRSTPSDFSVQGSALNVASSAPSSPPPSGSIWHRMGDCGYLDADDRLWFCGRKAERVETRAGILYTEPCEQRFRSHPRVERCALIGLGVRGDQEPALVVQPVKTSTVTDETQLARELLEIAAQHPATTGIRKIFFHPRFPVDVRHNAKIHRLTLAQWAATARSFPREA